MVITSQDMNLMDLDISWIWPDNVPAFQTKWRSYFTTPNVATKKEIIDSLIITMTSWFLWRLFGDGNFSMAICRTFQLQSAPRHFGSPVLDEWMIPIPQPFSASAARRAPHAPLSNLATCLRAARRGHDGGKRRGIHVWCASMWKGIREDVWLERCYCYGN